MNLIELLTLKDSIDKEQLNLIFDINNSGLNRIERRKKIKKVNDIYLSNLSNLKLSLQS